MTSNVFTDFPTLKILVSHGGGAIPYQFARFEASSLRGKGPRFSDQMRKLYYDTVLYSKDALELLASRRWVSIGACSARSGRG